MTHITVYTDPRGWKWVVEVPSDIIDEREYRHGLRLGPPELTSLAEAVGLSSSDHKKLHNALCDAMLYSYETLNHRGAEATSIIKSIVPADKAREAYRYLVALFQQADVVKDDQQLF